MSRGFFSLPPELRLRIYGLLAPRNDIIAFDRGAITVFSASSLTNLPSLLLVNQQIHQEVLEVLYGENQFRFFLRSNDYFRFDERDPKANSFALLSPAALRRIRNCELVIRHPISLMGPYNEAQNNLKYFVKALLQATDLSLSSSPSPSSSFSYALRNLKIALVPGNLDPTFHSLFASTPATSTRRTTNATITTTATTTTTTNYNQTPRPHRKRSYNAQPPPPFFTWPQLSSLLLHDSATDLSPRQHVLEPLAPLRGIDSVLVSARISPSFKAKLIRLLTAKPRAGVKGPVRKKYATVVVRKPAMAWKSVERPEEVVCLKDFWEAELEWEGWEEA